MPTQTTGTAIDYRSPAELYDPRILTILAIASILFVATMVAQGASHELLHDARHAAGVVCH